jgi:cobalt-zinc-cadmium efflux system membrane fusion protein
MKPRRMNPMREKMKRMEFAIRIGMVLVALLWSYSGCSPADEHNSSDHGTAEKLIEHAEAEGHEGHSHGLEHGERGEGGSALSPDEIEAVNCEHDIPAYTCAECRYEVGVVRVPAALLSDAAADEQGLVRTEAVTNHPVRDALRGTGEVQFNGNAAVHISPRIPGIIREVRVDIGARVRKGDILFILDSVELGKALSGYERSRTLAGLSMKNFQREKDLFKRKISSERDMIEAQMVYEEHNAERKASEQALYALGFTREDLAAIQQGDHGFVRGSLPVRAPMDGTIIRKHAVVGERVEPGSDVMFLAELTTVWVWADIYEQDLPRLIEERKKGTIPAEVFVRAFPGVAFPGGIDYIGATMEERTRTVKVRATVENRDRLLRPGMFCEIRMGITDGEEVLAIPREALLSDEGMEFVFIHWKGDYFLRRPVKKGREFFDHVEILEGLRDGDRIVNQGAFLLKSDILREKMGAGCAD